MRINAFIKGLLLPVVAATLFNCACGREPVPAAAGTLSVSPAKVEATYDAGTVTLAVTSDCDWGVSVADKDWCTVSPSGGIKGTSSVTVTLTTNRSGKARETTLTFRYGSNKLEVPVVQGFSDDDVPVGPGEMVVPDGYVLDWNDEFEGADGSLPDTDLWRFENKPAGWVNHELQTYVGAGRNGVQTAFLEDGALNIRAIRDGNDIISARMYSKKSWTYGYTICSPARCTSDCLRTTGWHISPRLPCRN